MEWFEGRPSMPRGGGSSSGSFYHLSFRSGSRAGGACAGAAHSYITRTEEYDDPERDAATYTESDHMPSWARDDSHEYWDAADLFERANGRLYLSADFALPRDLPSEDQVSLAHAFAQELTADERLPYTMVIHAGHDGEGHEHNPHAHLMISERRNARRHDDAGRTAPIRTLMKWDFRSQEDQRLRIPGITIARRIRSSGMRTHSTTNHLASRSNVNQRNRLRIEAFLLAPVVVEEHCAGGFGGSVLSTEVDDEKNLLAWEAVNPRLRFATRPKGESAASSFGNR
jgi:hypothetical protein